MTGRLGDRVVVVAGGATGIGAATARRLGAEGARVVVGDLNESGAAETADAIVGEGGQAIAVACDISDEPAVAAMFRRAVDVYGGVDLLFNVAADLSRECAGRDTDLLDLDLSVWDRTMAVNLRGYALTMRAAIPLMLERGAGAIVNTSSAAAFGGSDLQRPAYGVSKAGINALTRHVAGFWGPSGIRCNAIAPGFIETASSTKLPPEYIEASRLRNPSRRHGVPDDIASMVVFLLSDESSYVTGQVLHVNGGIGMW